MFKWLTNNVWGVTLSAVYIYLATVAISLGYVTYFNVPTDFIEVSLRQNILFALSAWQLIFLILKSLGYFWSSLIILALLCLLVFLIRKYRDSTFFSSFCVIVLILVLFGLYWFGQALAAGKNAHYTLAENCSMDSDVVGYVIVTFYEKSAILVPYEKNTNLLKGGFRVINLEQPNCTIDYKNIGRLERRSEW